MTDLFGRLIIDIDGKNLSNDDKTILSSKHIGGLILFSRNFDSYDQLNNLIKEVHLIKENIIIAVDQEGGRVQRFEKEYTKIPSMQDASLFAKENNDKEVFSGESLISSAYNRVAEPYANYVNEQDTRNRILILIVQDIRRQLALFRKNQVK